jgi:hypothetical protein
VGAAFPHALCIPLEGCCYWLFTLRQGFLRIGVRGRGNGRGQSV